ncbi:hypothetical protein BgiBS90_030749, partial [Biomphalaria glabrata]
MLGFRRADDRTHCTLMTEIVQMEEELGGERRMGGIDYSQGAINTRDIWQQLFTGD